MTDNLLHKVYNRMVAAPAPPVVPPQASPPVQTRRSPMQAGRYARWHVETTATHEEETWVVSYMDVVTLLLVMLVVMLAFSEPAGTKTLPTVEAPVVPTVPSPPKAAPPATTAEVAGPGRPESLAGLPLDDLEGQVEVLVSPTTVNFRINSEVLFASGDAQLTPNGGELMDKLLPVFNKAPDHTIVVVGHTDNVPIQTARFPSNWELSAARAGAVVRHLQARGLNPTRLRAMGYADTQPLATNATPQGRSANRRVEIVMEAPRQQP